MDKQEYWESRYTVEGKIWGESPSQSAHSALKLFMVNNVKTVLVPGSGYGRNTKLFSSVGLDVTGIEISATAYKMAGQFDPRSKFYQGTVLEMSFDNRRYDAVYCYNVLHLFHQPERELFLNQCVGKLKKNGLVYFTVFSDKESTFGQGKETEPNTFESKPGRPVHYFAEADLINHFYSFNILETGTIADPEDHGGQAHTHILRYIFASKT
jgi:SAM-dependent methyltransferase